MAYIETRPKSRYWHFSFLADRKRYRGSTGVIAKDSAQPKKLVNRVKAQNKANSIQQFFTDRNADGLIMLGQKQLAAKLLKLNHEQQPKKSATFEAAFRKYLEDYKTDRQPAPDYFLLIEKYYLNHFKEHWRNISDITEESIRQYKIKREIKPITLHKELTILKCFLRWCHKEGYLEQVPEFTLPSGKSKFRSKPPSREEVELILGKLPDVHTAYGINKQKHPIREFFTFMFFQGLRRGTVEKAEWSDVFVEDSKWFFSIRPETDKAKYGRVVPLHPRSIAALKSVGVKDSGLIFGRHDYRAMLGKVLEGLKLANIRLHDFRHSRITHLTQETKDLVGIMFLVGHRHIRTMQTYLHPNTERVERIFEEEEK